MTEKEAKIERAKEALKLNSEYSTEEIERIIRVLYGDGKVDPALII